MPITIRTLRRNDIPAWVDLINTVDHVDQLGRLTAVGDRQAMLASPFYQARHVWLAWQGNQCVGYIDAYLPPGERAISNGMVHPAYRGQGIGRCLLHTLLDQASSFAKVFVDIPVVPRMQDAANLLKSEGFALARYWWEMAWTGYSAPPQPDWPPGTGSRALRINHDEAAWAEVDQVVFAGAWGSWPHTQEELRALVSRPDFKPDQVLFALADGQIVGECQAIVAPVVPDRPRTGRIDDLGIVPAYRGRGLGRALLRHAMCQLYGQGCRLIELTVDGPNSDARRLYESERFTVASQLHWYRISPIMHFEGA